MSKCKHCEGLGCDGNCEATKEYERNKETSDELKKLRAKRVVVAAIGGALELIVSCFVGMVMVGAYIHLSKTYQTEIHIGLIVASIIGGGIGYLNFRIKERHEAVQQELTKVTAKEVFYTEISKLTGDKK